MLAQPKSKRLLRSEVPVELTWDLSDLFATREDWEKELAAVQKDVSTVTQFEGKLDTGAKTFLDCLKSYEKYQNRLVLVSTYANLRFSADGTDPENQGDASMVNAALAKVSSQLAFLKSEILQMDEKTIERFLKEEPELNEFRMFLDDIFQAKPHTLSPETEKVLAALGEVHDSPYMIYQRSKSSDMQFASITDKNGEEQPMSFALYEDKYEISPDTDLRRKAYKSFVHTLKQYQNTFAAAYATEVTKQVTLANVRGYDSVTDMLLEPQKVTKDMYYNQLDIIKNELAPHMQKYAKLRKEVLGLDKLLFCDLKAPLDPEFNPSSSYEEAKETILNALSVMGDEYTEIMRRGLNERWVDLADNVGKSTGAFCSSPYGVHPYILITWTDSMRSVFVLAHELGHAGHFYLAGKNQRLVNTRPSTYFIEAPSTMNEMLLGQYLLSKTDNNRMQRWVIQQLLNTYYHNFVTHLLEGEYQRRVYDWAENGKPVTSQVLTDIKGNVLKEFWGNEVEIDEGAALTWMRQPHYYMGLYPYTYSAGLTVSTAVAEKIKTEGKPAVDMWLEVLKAGGTLRPLDLIKKAGVDMSTPEPVRNAVRYVGSLIDELIKSYQ